MIKLNKVYKVTIGSRHKDYESHNVDSRNVIATDVFKALRQTVGWIEEERKKAKKNKEEIWVQEVELITSIDIN